MEKLEPKRKDDATTATNGGDRLVAVVVLVVILVGIVLRLRVYVFDRSLWLDELFLWTTLGDTDLLRAFRPLGEGQVAAPGFLLVVQVLRRLFGDSEFVLRLPALIAGIAALPLMYAASKRVVGARWGVLPLLLVVVSPQAIYYSSEFKPYSLDLSVSLVLLLLGHDALDEPRSARVGRAVRLAAVAATGVFVSLPAILVVGAVCGALAIVRWLRRDLGGVALATLPALAGGLVFFLQYHFLLSQNHVSHDLYDYWIKLEAFPLGPWYSAEALTWYPNSIVRLLAEPTGFGDMWGRALPHTYIAAGLFLIGAIDFVRARKIAALALCLVLGLAWIAAALGKYPLAARVAFFVVPTLSIFVARAIAVLSRFAPTRPLRLWLVVGCFYLVWPSVGGTIGRFIRPHTREENRAVLTELAKSLRPGDTVYLTWWGRYGWRYYAPRVGIDSFPTIEAKCSRVEDLERDLEANGDALPRSDRVWMYAAHFYPSDDERKRALSIFEAHGATVVESIEASAAAAHRLDLTRFRK